MLLFFSNSFFLNKAFQLWEIPATKYQDLGKYDFGIVLGGMVSYDHQLDRLHFHNGVDRLLQAIDLYKKGYIKKIFFVGGSGSIVLKEDKEAIWIKKYLLLIGIPDEDLLIESESRNTRENALFTKKIMQTNNLNGQLLLITSAFHMRRSLGCFNKAGLRTEPYSTDRYGGLTKYDLGFLLIPTIDALNGWDLLIHEMVGYAVYRIAGYA